MRELSSRKLSSFLNGFLPLRSNRFLCAVAMNEHGGREGGKNNSGNDREKNLPTGTILI